MAEIQVLPSEIFLGIFSRLPVKTLLQSRCVCKAWCNMIDDPQLATIHLNHTYSLHHRPMSVLFIDKLRDKHRSDQAHDTIFFRSLDINEDQTCKTIEIGKFSVRKGIERPSFYPLYNGLVCFAVQVSSSSVDGISTYDVYLCNPFKPKETIRLPQATPARPGQNYGLGFDSTTNTYKILRVYSDLGDDAYSRALELEIRRPIKLEIHTLGTKTWRKLGQKLPHVFLGSPVYADGFLYWSQSYVTRSYVIVAFDLANEVMDWIPSPPGVLRPYHLFNLQGCLALFDRTRDEGDESSGYIWLLKETNKFESWVKVYNHFDTSQVYNTLKVLGMWDDSHMLFYIGGYVMSYNTKTHQFDRLYIEGMLSHLRQVTGFATSLFLPSHLNMY